MSHSGPDRHPGTSPSRRTRSSLLAPVTGPSPTSPSSHNVKASLCASDARADSAKAASQQSPSPQRLTRSMQAHSTAGDDPPGSSHGAPSSSHGAASTAADTRRHSARLSPAGPSELDAVPDAPSSSHRPASTAADTRRRSERLSPAGPSDFEATSNAPSSSHGAASSGAQTRRKGAGLTPANPSQHADAVVVNQSPAALSSPVSIRSARSIPDHHPVSSAQSPPQVVTSAVSPRSQHPVSSAKSPRSQHPVSPERLAKSLPAEVTGGNPVPGEGSVHAGHVEASPRQTRSQRAIASTTGHRPHHQSRSCLDCFERMGCVLHCTTAPSSVSSYALRIMTWWCCLCLSVGTIQDDLPHVSYD